MDEGWKDGWTRAVLLERKAGTRKGMGLPFLIQIKWTTTAMPREDISNSDALAKPASSANLNITRISCRSCRHEYTKCSQHGRLL